MGLTERRGSKLFPISVINISMSKNYPSYLGYLGAELKVVKQLYSGSGITLKATLMRRSATSVGIV